MGDLKQRAFEILQIPSRPGDQAGRAFDLFIMALISLNVVAVIFETVGDNATRYGRWLQIFEMSSLVVFGTEYVLRMWSITANPMYAHPLRGRLKFAATPIAIIDLLAILPAVFWFVDLRFVRVVRLLRLLKLGRYSTSMATLTRVVQSRAQPLGMSVFLVGMALVMTSSLMYYAEHEAQPEVFSSIPAAMWWGIVTLTTTGYGDIVPVTPVGKMLGGLTAIIGVGAIALPVGILAGGFVQEIERAQGAGENACPHCGKLPHEPVHLRPSGPSGEKAEDLPQLKRGA